MANVNAPRGLVPVANFAGAPYNGSVRYYAHASGDSQAIFVGDLVTATGDSIFKNIGGSVQSIPVVAQSVTGGVFQGVCIGVMPTDQANPIYAPADTEVIVLVADDPNILCIAQDANSGTPLTANSVGLNIDVSVGSGSTVTGMSGMVLDNTTEATTNTLDLKIIGQYLDPSNELGSSVSSGAAAGRYLVKLNRHRFANQVAGI